MDGPLLEVADIFREHGDSYRRHHRTTCDQRRVMWAIENCRTASLGGHVYECEYCSERQNRYNSCRNRHCPRCQSLETAAWLEARERDLLPVPYFHVVFTIPDRLHPLFLSHQRFLYSALFASAWDALRTVAKDPSRMGAAVGALAVLHTWSQNLGYHPHVHCVVPGGGLTSGGRRWISAGEEHLLPVTVLSARFRSVLLARIDAAYKHQQLDFGGSVSELAHPVRFADFLDEMRFRPWVVYAKKPFAGPREVLRYLARYTHRVAITNYRLLEHRKGCVRFTYKDYRTGGQRKTMRLTANEFIRRFLLHVLPPRFVRLRYFGFLANRNRRAAVERIRGLLTCEPCDELSEGESGPGRATDRGDVEMDRCPACGIGRLVPVALPPLASGARAPPPTMPP